MALQSMPEEMAEKLFQIDDPDAIREIQQQWHEYTVANDNYERVYPQQFAAIVEGNQKFKENKSIPTPAEQMAGYKDIVMHAIEDNLAGKDKQTGEQTYELEETTKEQAAQDHPMGKFQLSFGDMSLRDKQQVQTPENNKEQKSLDNAQEHKEQQEREGREPTHTKEENRDKPYELNLTFGRLEELDKSDPGILPEAPEPEPGD